MLGLSSSLVKGGASLLTFVKDNLKLYLDFNSKKSDTLKFPSEGSTSFVAGSSQYISVANDSSLTFTTALSVSCWVNFTTASGDQTFIADWDYPNNGRSFQFRWNDDSTDKLEFHACGDGSTIKTNTVNWTPTVGRWYHLSATYDAGTSKIYIDGVSQTVTSDANQPTSLHSSSDPILIGATGDATTRGNYMNGKIANVGIWSRVLSPEEIQSIMNKSYSQLKGVEKTSLVAWWALDDVQKVTDNSVSSGLIESETGEILSSDVKSFDSITGLGNNYTNNILEFVKNGYAFFNISGIAQGKLYRLTYTVLTQTGSGLAHSGGSSAFTGGIPTTVGSHEQYLVAGSANLLVMRSTGFRGTITDIVLQEVSNRCSHRSNNYHISIWWQCTNLTSCS